MTPEQFTSQQWAALGAAIPVAVFDFRGLAGLDAHIDRTVHRIRTELVDDVATLVRQQVRDRIRNEKRTPDGRPWPPRKPSKRDGGHPLLVKSAKLFDSITRLRQPRGAVVTSFHKIAWYQNLGTRRGIPSRQFMGLGVASVAEVQRLIDLWVELNQ